jgi:hypothetical protein
MGGSVGGGGGGAVPLPSSGSWQEQYDYGPGHSAADYSYGHVQDYEGEAQVAGRSSPLARSIGNREWVAGSAPIDLVL